MYKKLFISFLLSAVALSPLIPTANADIGTWKSTMIDRVWDYGTYQVSRVVTDKNIQGPFVKNGVAFIYTPSSLNSQVDLSLLQNGKTRLISGVGDQITKPESFIGHSEFEFDVPSKQTDQWTSVFMFDPSAQTVSEKTTITRKSNELNLISYTTEKDRVYGSFLASDKKTGDVKANLFVKDFSGTYENRDFAFFMNNPMQRIVDVNDGVSLVKMEFPGGNEQLWLMNDRTQHVEAIPNTWTEPNSDLVYPHFLSDGTIVYFQNFRFFTFNPSTDKIPQSHSGTNLNWFVSPESSVQIDGDRMVWMDSENNLFVNTISGVYKIGVVKNSNYHLVGDIVSFDSVDGYRSYNVSSKTWSQPSFLVTSSIEDIQIGIDRESNIWYKNLTSGLEMKIGRGINPVLSDRTHAYWKGIDGVIYQATLSTILDVSKSSYHAYRSATNSAVYLVKDQSIWNVKDEVTYFTWFDSWKSVSVVNDETMKTYLASYSNKGDANFAPGTWIKSTANPRVYIIGTDGSLHWVVSETVAKSLNGSLWSRNLKEVPDTYLWRFATGKNILNTSSVLSI